MIRLLLIFLCSLMPLRSFGSPYSSVNEPPCEKIFGPDLVGVTESRLGSLETFNFSVGEDYVFRVSRSHGNGLRQIVKFQWLGTASLDQINKLVNSIVDFAHAKVGFVFQNDQSGFFKVFSGHIRSLPTPEESRICSACSMANQVTNIEVHSTKTVRAYSDQASLIVPREVAAGAVEIQIALGSPLHSNPWQSLSEFVSETAKSEILQKHATDVLDAVRSTVF